MRREGCCWRDAGRDRQSCVSGQAKLLVMDFPLAYCRSLPRPAFPCLRSASPCLILPHTLPLSATPCLFHNFPFSLSLSYSLSFSAEKRMSNILSTFFASVFNSENYNDILTAPAIQTGHNETLSSFTITGETCIEKLKVNTSPGADTIPPPQ